ncbi:MAG: hypothetical protein SNF93_00930 [Rikenellaceae bacterium]
MNKNYFAPLALAFALMVGCQAEAELAPSVEAPEATDSKIILEASAGVQTKVAYAQGEGAINATWESDDAFSVYDATGAYVGDFTYTGTAGSATGTFTQDGNFTMEDGTYTAVIPASDAATLNERITWTTSNQTNNVSASSLDHLSAAVRLSAEFDYSSQSTSLTFAHEVSLLKLDVTLAVEDYINSISIADGDNTYYLYFNGDGIMDSSFTTYMAVEPTDGTERDITFTFMGEGSYSITKTSSTAFAAGSFYTATLDFTASDDTDSDVIDYYETGWTAPNGVTYSKETEGVSLLTSSGGIIKAAGGVYFLDPESDDVEFSLKNGTHSTTIVIGRYSNSQPKVYCSGQVYLGAGGGLICTNIDFTGCTENYTFNFPSSSTTAGIVEYFAFEDCTIKTGVADTNFSWFSNAGGSVENVIWNNNIINVELTNNAGAGRLMSFKASGYGDNHKLLEFKNNIIYSSTGYYANGALISMEADITTADNLEVFVENNTFVNYLATSLAYVTIPSAKGITIKNNIMWAASDTAATSYLLRFTNDSAVLPATCDYDGNVVYGLKNDTAWTIFSSGTSAYLPEGVAASGNFTKESTDPLAVCDYASGIFTQAEGYEDKGATIAWQQVE